MKSRPITSSTLVIFLLFSFSGMEPVTSQRDLCFDLTARFALAAPDGVRKEIITVNDQFPGPTLRVRMHDRVTIRVRNELVDSSGAEHPTSVHFHGIEMRGTPWFDGPEQVAQCPIPYGASKNYTFTLQQSGTYWYHSHHASQYVDGFWGLFIVENFPAEAEVHEYDDELSLTLMDWHWRTGPILSNLLRMPRDLTPGREAGMTPVPDSALINGYGNADCELASGKGHQCDPIGANLVTMFDVVPGKTYRIRLANPSARATFRFSIDGHRLRAIETDGVDTVEVEPVDEVDIWPAQRYSFLVTMNSSSQADQGNYYWIRTKLLVGTGDQALLEKIQPLAALRYMEPGGSGPSFLFKSVGGGTQGRPAEHLPNGPLPANFSSSSSALLQPDSNTCATFVTPLTNTDKSQSGRIDKNSLVVTSTRSPFPVLLDQSKCRSMEARGVLDTAPQGPADQSIVLNAVFHVDDLGAFKGLINGLAYNTEENELPALFRVSKDIPIPESFRPQYTPNLGEVVELVINNLNGSFGTGGHPWHLHGHTFWVLGTGEIGDGPYQPVRDGGKLNIPGLRRDTTHTPPNSWTVVRYRVDNAGVWLMHCHIHWHLEIGLAAIFVEGQEVLKSEPDRIPEEARRVCALNDVLI